MTRSLPVLSLLLSLTVSSSLRADPIPPPSLSSSEVVASPEPKLTAPIRYIPKAERMANKAARIEREKKKASCPQRADAKSETVTVCAPYIPARKADVTQSAVPQAQRSLSPINLGEGSSIGFR